ncbi:hypothetical protein ACIBKX_33005 [Streptomyces sp. NPDC050658]|uniref:hypothetical protein n=1 Tax=unclassified Streptomyces TaxID=2593676 RepID=UPI00342B0E51
MTAVLPERPTGRGRSLPIPETAEPVVLPGPLPATEQSVPRRIPRWITDPCLIESILAGHIEIPDDLNPQEAAAPVPGCELALPDFSAG